MTHIDIVFDGPPGPTSGRFVEVENSKGESVDFGTWLTREDGRVVLRFERDPSVLGRSLAMRVLQSDLYFQLDEVERGECDALIHDHLEALRNACKRSATEKSTVRTENFGLDAAQIRALRNAGLKPEEIAGAPDVQQERITELLHWFARFTRGEANGKWAVEHAFELAYYIASNGINRTIDMRESKQAAYLEGVNISDSDRGMLERYGAIKPRPVPLRADHAKDTP
jgi:hypothetical protein